MGYSINMFSAYYLTPQRESGILRRTRILRYVRNHADDRAADFYREGDIQRFECICWLMIIGVTKVCGICYHHSFKSQNGL